MRPGEARNETKRGFVIGIHKRKPDHAYVFYIHASLKAIHSRGLRAARTLALDSKSLGSRYNCPNLNLSHV